MTATRRVAVMVDLRSALRQHHDVFAGILRYAHEQANWDCIVHPFVDSLPQGKNGQAFQGIIARATLALAKQAAQAGVPMVNVWSGSPAKSLPAVLPDFAAIGRMAAEHLIERGLRRFAFLGLSPSAESRMALAGFTAVLCAANFRCEVQFMSSRWDADAQAWQESAERLDQWIRGWTPPLGVFAIQDVICRFLANGCLQAGLRVPEDVALIGCGNEPLVCDHPEPAMSSVDAGHERVGYEAAALLNRLMDGEENPQGPLMIAPKELVVRHSTDACMLDDSLVATALKFIAEQCHKGIRGDDVAQHVHTAERSLRRRFLAATGHTMMEEIARLRLERAKRLLVESDEPVKQVALECSFSNAAYFHRVFVQNEGISPGDYRRQRGKHGQSHL